MSDSPARHDRFFDILKYVAVVVCLIAGTSATTIAVTQFLSSPRLQPLSITACAPDSYTPPVPTADDPNVYEHGPTQEECQRVFASRNDHWVIGSPVVVVGQVCNNGDTPVAYQVEVAYESVSTPNLRLAVLSVPITYDPGCHAPYEFPFDFPCQSACQQIGPGESLGLWRIVGTATPVNTEKFLPYQWDATGTVEYINPKEAP